MLLPLDGVHVQHVHGVLHAVVAGRVGAQGPAPCPSHHTSHTSLHSTELGEELRVEIHSTGCLELEKRQNNDQRSKN